MPLRSLLPYRRIAIETPLSPDEVRKRIDSVVEPRRWLRSPWASGERAYEGVWKGDHFRISRIIHHRNSFLPVIRGEILPWYLGKTTVVLRMRPAIGVLIFMAVWLGGVGSICIGMLMAVFRQIGRQTLTISAAPSLIPFGMFAFGAVLLYGAFLNEAGKSRRFFSELLNGAETGS